jgi:cytoskeletal protein RodZ
MDSVFQELQRAREARHLSIGDVSDATLINATFLEAIERGNTTVLPQTYVRAFIREYATFVGLDPLEIMRQYDLANGEGPHSQEGDKQPAPASGQPSEEKKEQKEAEPHHPAPLAPIVSKFAFPAILIIALGIVIWNLSRTKSPPSGKDIPAQDATQHQRPEDSTATSSAAQSATTRAASDSLTLRAVLTDSAWVEITIDNLKPQQYVFRPNRKIEWKAKDRFRLSTGNAGAIDLTLNNKHLGVPGKRRAIIRSLEFNRRTLEPH